jgi:hypothetical protein
MFAIINAISFHILNHLVWGREGTAGKRALRGRKTAASPFPRIMKLLYSMTSLDISFVAVVLDPKGTTATSVALVMSFSRMELTRELR